MSREVTKRNFDPLCARVDVSGPNLYKSGASVRARFRTRIRQTRAGLHYVVLDGAEKFCGHNRQSAHEPRFRARDGKSHAT